MNIFFRIFGKMQCILSQDSPSPQMRTVLSGKRAHFSGNQGSRKALFVLQTHFYGRGDEAKMQTMPEHTYETLFWGLAFKAARPAKQILLKYYGQHLRHGAASLSRQKNRKAPTRVWRKGEPADCGNVPNGSE